MISLLPLLLAAQSCTGGTVQAALLEANRRATLVSRPSTGTVTAVYGYSGQGMSGRTNSRIDTKTGRFVVKEAIGPITGAAGFDGMVAWAQDLSGSTLPQEGGDKRQLAVNAAYRNADRWWAHDRGGAKIEPVDCGGLRVTPIGGEPFDAFFDPATHLLSRIHERRSFGAIVDTVYSNYKRRGGRMVATRIETTTGGDSATLETLDLRQYSVSPTLAASRYARPVREPTDWQLPPSGMVVLPFRLLNNHIFVDVKINDRGPFPFLVDTGGHNILTPATIAALSVRSQGSSPSGGAGEKTVSNGYAHVDRIDAGGVVMNNQTVVTLDFSPKDVEGLQVGGMLGVEFVERFVVRIDYGARKMTIIDPKRFDPRILGYGAVAIPFKFYEHMPQVEGAFDGRPARFNIDTGSRSELTLTSPFVESARLVSAYRDGVTVTDGWGVGGPSRSYVVRGGSIMLGKLRVDRPITGLSAAKHGAFSDTAYEGNIGSGLLKRYVVTFDYAHQTMYLTPTVKPDTDIGRFDRVGIWINLGHGGMEVMDVAAGSPAEIAGLKVGDIITAIGTLTTEGQSLSEVRRSLKLLPLGERVTFTVKREGVVQTRDVIPRELIPG